MNRFVRAAFLIATSSLVVVASDRAPASAALPNGEHEVGVNGAVGADCSFGGHKLFGKVKVVDSFPDIKVKKVDSFPDIKVKKVDSFPDDCGKWKFVDSFPDFKIKYVDSFPDIKVKFVDSFPGVN